MQEFPIIKRSAAGLFLGAWVGLLYGLVSTHINVLFIRDVPLYYNVQSAFNSIVWSVIVAALLGILVNLPYYALSGVALASLVGAIGVAAQGVLDTADSVEGLFSTIFLMAYMFLPLVILFVPFNALLRWSSQQILSGSERPGWTWPRLRSLVLCTFLSLLVGSFSLYPANARKMLQRMDGFIQAAKSDSGSVPYEFSQAAPVAQNASPQYRLAWTDDTSVYPDMLFYEDSLTAFRLQVVSAHFQSGESIYCLFREMDGNLYLCSVGAAQP